MDSHKELRLLIQTPDLNPRSQTLSLNPTQFLTLSHLKPLLLPRSQSITLDSYFTSNGRALPDSTPISSALLPSLTLRLRLRGGGGDGGATGAESRDCYLNMYATKKPDKADPNETRLSRWTTCALSSEPLAHPVVIDRLGSLFNKEPLVEALIHKKLPKAFSHIRGLKDMIPVHLSPVPGESDSEAKFQCPITGLEFNGKYGFLAIRGCGHVLSVKAFKEVKSSACLVCHKEFADLDKIVINGTAEEVAALRERMEEERGKVGKVKERKEKKGLGASLDGVKRGCGDEIEDGRKDRDHKKFKAGVAVPANATKEVYESIFISSKKKSDFKETYSCRSLPLGRN
ncbi:putative replication termination factor 2 [Dioscorea sansibarensis]